MATLQAGTILTCVIGGQDKIISIFNWYPLETRIARQMPDTIPIKSLTLEADRLVSAQTLPDLLGNSYHYVATIQVVAMTDYGDPADLLSIVKGACWNATGIEPIAASITEISGRPTGEPSQANPVGFDPFAWLADLPREIMIVGVVAVIGLAVVVWGPKTNLRASFLK